jgi:hypothetical protein
MTVQGREAAVTQSEAMEIGFTKVRPYLEAKGAAIVNEIAELKHKLIDMQALYEMHKRLLYESRESMDIGPINPQCSQAEPPDWTQEIEDMPPPDWTLEDTSR